jgi:hypothetical protein
MFPVRYEHYVHTKKAKLSLYQAVEAHMCFLGDIKKLSYPRNRPWGPILVSGEDHTLYGQAVHSWR